MQSSTTGSVCIIIAARNAEETIARAVQSALREPEVGEVVVVNDGSSDATEARANQADDGTGRLKVIRLWQNRGPAFARNRAIEASTAPFVGILDADDFFIEGRFTNLLAADDWDFVADNVAFVAAGSRSASEPDVARFRADPSFLDLTQFIEGNIARRGAPRGEMGFLKPLMRRSFLDAHGLRYREDMRLGEDFDLYARALARGARYKVLRSCGYGALVRPDSLSGRHRTEDLKRAFEADRSILADGGLSQEEARALRRHERHMRRRYEQRSFLDMKARHGLVTAAFRGLGRPLALPGIATDIFRDKMEVFRGRTGASIPARVETQAIRYLLPAVAAPQK